MNQQRLTSVMKLHLRDKTSWFLTPWLIIAATFIINFIITLSLHTDETMHTGSIAAIFVYTFVAGVITIKETFSFALGLSIRRIDYFLGTAVTAIFVSCSSAIAITVLSLIEGATNGWGVRLNFFKIESFSDISIVGLIGIYLILLLHMYFLGFAISSLHRRYGRNAMYAFFATLFLLGSIGTYVFTRFGLWGGIFTWLIQHYLELFW
ncbi:hypothetical protein [Paenibacillus sp. N3.4]|uniref:hypothetical protein n=1 Tax=Paenibacillus sp. N3.4 TaxID=2603222 RepID=UPI0011CB2E03|nr:hypothetical protein [Paenibacillus sp. N3.4]TXK82662.1 hypothetical protein FU659_14345 [Paenibacillus sp. N3.4]